MHDAPVIARNRRELAAALADTSGTRALVMTMGALHEGHLTLVREARRIADHVVVSIFVNPTQFAPGEDYDAYPRTLEADVGKLRSVGVEVVYAPEPEDVYPVAPLVSIDPGPIAHVLEGATRPTHLAGVALVVTKVFGLTRPDVAFFGQKDAQQLAMVRTLVRDLDLPVRIQAVPIARDTDGVALSSRNRYLSEDERVHARALSRALRVGSDAADGGASASGVLAVAGAVLGDEDGVEVDYVALADPETFAPVEDGAPAGTEAFLLVAARVGATRLIDNTLVTLGGGSSQGGE
ncbi:pantoate--beta-alanine ligase [Actinomyces polynesiensis]|uniref:pantoate--beta-alanine ligase n=1 Tax=Actinomyces polynesiensis TaxID=1325934 RepID=UPI0005BE4831|nr:pantoate--beta-alanine ligase [Actinomyces polynesiensis]